MSRNSSSCSGWQIGTIGREDAEFEHNLVDDGYSATQVSDRYMATLKILRSYLLLFDYFYNLIYRIGLKYIKV